MLSYDDSDLYKSDDKIFHRGEIISISGDTASVHIIDNKDCDSCSIYKFCKNGHIENMSTIEVVIPQKLTPRVGDIVEISGTERLHKKAIRLLTIYPIILVISIMVGVYLLSKNQVLSALCGFISILLFFVVIWSARNRLEHEFAFELNRVIKKNE